MPNTKLYLRRKAEGLCPVCGSSMEHKPGTRRYVLCPTCRSRARERSASRYKACRASGICTMCGDKARVGTARCLECLVAMREYNAKSKREQRSRGRKWSSP